MELERLIRERREAFDEVEEPRTELMWSRIRGTMDDQPETAAPRRLLPKRRGEDSGWRLSVGRYWRWSIAAGIALTLGIFLSWPSGPGAEDRSLQLSDYYPEFAEEEQRYERLIAQKEAALELDQLDSRNYKTLFEELTLLDEIHDQYLKDLPRYYDNEQLVRTLIKYYEHKIRILERLSLEIEKKKHYEERNRETPL
jgi:hypothetical protein